MNFSRHWIAAMCLPVFLNIKLELLAHHSGDGIRWKRQLHWQGLHGILSFQSSPTSESKILACRYCTAVGDMELLLRLKILLAEALYTHDQSDRVHQWYNSTFKWVPLMSVCRYVRHASMPRTNLAMLPSPTTLCPSEAIMLPESSQMKNLTGMLESPLIRAFWRPGGQELLER